MPLRARLFDAEGRDEDVEPTSEIVRRLGKRQLLWIDVDGREEGDVAALADLLELPESVTTRMQDTDTGAGLHRFPGLVYLRMVAVQPAEPDSHRPVLETAPIDIVAKENLVATTHAGTVVAFDEFEDHLHGDTDLGTLDAAALVAALVDSVLLVYLEVVERVGRRVDALDELALRAGDDRRFLEEVVLLRRRVAGVRRALAPHRIALAPLGRPDLEISELGRPWPGLLERLDRTIDAVENARDLLLGSFDVFSARAAHRTNAIMKTLTLLNAVLLPVAVIAGIMGMNFRLEFFDSPENFWLVAAAMLLLALGILGFSRWRGWI